jgi:hypothetical protein
MTQLLTIPTVTATAGLPGITFNVDLITTVVYTGTTTFVIYVNNRTYTFTTTSNAAGTVANINAAMAAGGKPLQSFVTLPAGVTIPTMPVLA